MSDELRRRTRRSFLSLGAASAAAVAGWSYLRSGSGANLFREAFEWNGALWDKLASNARLAATYPHELAREPRINGREGLKSKLDPATWRLELLGLVPGDTIYRRMDDLLRLPRREITTQLKCVEGWSVIVTWAGVRFADFVASHPTVDYGRKYVGASTPDGGYYVGMSFETAVHPQTLLCWEMNGQPLTPEHGGPLRLVLPHAYGFKSLKRLGRLNFTDTRPPDYWAERGYDWHSTF